MAINLNFVPDPVKQQRRQLEMQQDLMNQAVPGAADALYTLQALQSQLGGSGLGQNFGIGPFTETGALQHRARQLAGLLANPLTGESTKPVASNFLQSQLMPQKPELTAAQKNFQFLQSLPEEQRKVFEQFAGGPRTEINVGQSEYGTIPPGYQLNRSEDGELSMTPIPGGPVETELNTAEEKKLRKSLLGQVSSGVVEEDISRAINITETTPIPVTGVGSFLKAIPGTPAKDVSALLETVKANVGFEKLQQMRENSPTGGALGQVSDFENKLLQSTLANLEQSQSQGQFLYNLKRLKDTFNLIVHGSASGPQGNQGAQNIINFEDLP